MARAKANGIEIEYETAGDRKNPALLLVMGLGAQLTIWPNRLFHGLADKGFFVIRYDNRDVGLSTDFGKWGPANILAALQAAMKGEKVSAPYLLDDMAADAIGLLDSLGIGGPVTTVTVAGGLATEAYLSTPTPTALYRRLCGPPKDQSVAAVVGRVRDVDTGKPIAEATVETFWAEFQYMASTFKRRLFKATTRTGPEPSPVQVNCRRSKSSRPRQAPGTNVVVARTLPSPRTTSTTIPSPSAVAWSGAAYTAGPTSQERR